jgi:CRP-like cAMP-binding protein
MATQPITHSLVKALRAVADFAGLDDATLLEIVGSSACLFWSAGSTVFAQGDPAEALYVVLSGRVRLVDRTDSAEDEAAHIGPGDYFGELFHTTHATYAQAVEDSECMVILRESFEPILTADPNLADRFRSRRRPRSARLSREMGGEAEGGEQVGVEEVVMPDDPVA